MFVLCIAKTKMLIQNIFISVNQHFLTKALIEFIVFHMKLLQDWTFSLKGQSEVTWCQAF